MLLSCRKRGRRILNVAGTVILVLVAAAAAAYAQAPKGRVSLTAQVGGCLPSLSDVNKDIRLGNQALTRYGWSTVDEIGFGYTFTGDLRARVYGPLTLSLGVGRTFAGSNINFDEVISVTARASFYHVRAFYDLPFKPMPKMTLRIGGGPVFVTNARVNVRHERRGVDGGTQWVESATFSAKGTGAHALIESELMLNQKTTLVIDLGYRSMKLDRSGNGNDFRDWKRAGVSNERGDTDGDGIVNVYDLQDGRNNAIGNEQKGYISASFLEVPVAPDGLPIEIGDGRALVHVRDLGKIDFSGPQGSVGLRFYLF
jgi:hypothetical protein